MVKGFKGSPTGFRMKGAIEVSGWRTEWWAKFIGLLAT